MWQLHNVSSGVVYLKLKKIRTYIFLHKNILFHCEKIDIVISYNVAAKKKQFLKNCKVYVKIVRDVTFALQYVFAKHIPTMRENTSATILQPNQNAQSN